MMQSIFIYAGPGTSPVAVNHTVYTLKNIVHPLYSIQKIGLQDIIEGTWESQAALLIMPGGEDVPYGAVLNGAGNQSIKEYVTKGGSYIGFCAGAYYGSKQVLFAQGTRQEVMGERELAFFPGTAVGPTFQPWDPDSNVGACMALLKGNGPLQSILNQQTVGIYMNGGGHFLDAHMFPDVEILATYVQGPHSPLPLPALIDISVGKGRVILSGVHCEFAPELFDLSDPFLFPLYTKLLPYKSLRLQIMRYLLERFGIVLHKANAHFQSLC
ncbi:MAG: biotin--protein ligase [Alphaproteobacteria bacterium]|nr:biotin--protein ligase [Alphaproteobacteria bacterium]